MGVYYMRSNIYWELGVRGFACVSKQKKKKICHSRDVIYIAVAQGGDCRLYGNSKFNRCWMLSLGHTVSITHSAVQCKQPMLSQDYELDYLWGLGNKNTPSCANKVGATGALEDQAGSIWHGLSLGIHMPLLLFLI